MNNNVACALIIILIKTAHSNASSKSIDIVLLVLYWRRFAGLLYYISANIR